MSQIFHHALPSFLFVWTSSALKTLHEDTLFDLLDYIYFIYVALAYVTATTERFSWFNSCSSHLQLSTTLTYFVWFFPFFIFLATMIWQQWIFFLCSKDRPPKCLRFSNMPMILLFILLCSNSSSEIFGQGFSGTVKKVGLCFSVFSSCWWWKVCCYIFRIIISLFVFFSFFLFNYVKLFHIKRK